MQYADTLINFSFSVLGFFDSNSLFFFLRGTPSYKYFSAINQETQNISVICICLWPFRCFWPKAIVAIVKYAAV